MLQIVKNRNRMIFTIIVCIVLIIVLIAHNSYAQSSASNMRQMLEDLSFQIDETPGFSIGFKFVEPLIDDELSWSIPYSDREFGVERWIGEIGDDYICFFELAGSANIVRCTPYTNIVGVVYLANP